MEERFDDYGKKNLNMKTVGSNLPVTMRYNIIVINMAIIDIPKHPPKQPTANILVS